MGNWIKTLQREFSGSLKADIQIYSGIVLTTKPPKMWTAVFWRNSGEKKLTKGTVSYRADLL